MPQLTESCPAYAPFFGFAGVAFAVSTSICTVYHADLFSDDI